MEIPPESNADALALTGQDTVAAAVSAASRAAGCRGDAAGSGAAAAPIPRRHRGEGCSRPCAARPGPRPRSPSRGAARCFTASCARASGVELVGGRVHLPLAGAVGRSPRSPARPRPRCSRPIPKPVSTSLFDLAPLRLRAGLPRAPLEGAHDTALDDRLQRVHAQRGLGSHQPDPLVPVRARGADQLVMGRTEPLPVHVLGRARPIKGITRRGWHCASRESVPGAPRVYGL